MPQKLIKNKLNRTIKKEIKKILCKEYSKV